MNIQTIIASSTEYDATDNPTDRYTKTSIKNTAQTAVNELLEMVSATTPLGIQTTDWAAGTTEGDYAITLDGNDLMVEWVTGPHSLAYIPADQVIPSDDVQRIITAWKNQ